ncbi:MAG: hypothetical protein PHW64_07655 [Sulfuricurvum sp.]|nr:hypothetical protein [Sulfuricurvum sp.]
MKVRLGLFSIMAACTLSADPVFKVEGYGEGYLLSGSRPTEKVARFTVEPSVTLNENLTLSTHIGFERPSESGGVAEAEIEALSLTLSLSEQTHLSFGKMHIPIGLYNLYHEPVYFLTLEPSRAEHIVIPTEWHETAFLLTHKMDQVSVTAGAMTPMDATKLTRENWIHQGKESFLSGGKKPGWLLRVDVGDINTVLYGASIVTTPLIGADAQATLAEAHISAYLDHGWEAKAIVTKGWIDSLQGVNAASGASISKSAEGGSLTLGYDISAASGLLSHTLIGFVHSEYAQPSHPLVPQGLGGTAHATGVNWFVTQKFVAKTEIRHSNHEGDRIGIGIGFVY